MIEAVGETPPGLHGSMHPEDTVSSLASVETRTSILEPDSAPSVDVLQTVYHSDPAADIDPGLVENRNCFLATCLDCWIVYHLIRVRGKTALWAQNNSIELFLVLI